VNSNSSSPNMIGMAKRTDNSPSSGGFHLTLVRILLAFAQTFKILAIFSVFMFVILFKRYCVPRCRRWVAKVREYMTLTGTTAKEERKFVSLELDVAGEIADDSVGGAVYDSSRGEENAAQAGYAAIDAVRNRGGFLVHVRTPHPGSTKTLTQEQIEENFESTCSFSFCIAGAVTQYLPSLSRYGA
jgi:hypothetical protein